MVKTERIKSDFDGLEIELEITIPDGDILGIVQISHGMAEHKKRYNHFMKYMSDCGYVVVINDHRGHGNSVRDINDLGYFYTENIEAIVGDLHQVTMYIKGMFPNKPLYLISHSMGTLVSRNYIKHYDNDIDKLIMTGPPTKNSLSLLAIAMAKISRTINGERHRNKFINNLIFGSYNKPEKEVNDWLCSKKDVVEEYNHDNLCGFVFTNNGFINLFKMLHSAFIKDGWCLKNKDLPILMLAGENDPIIQSHKKFYQLSSFLNEIGYKNTSAKLYKDKHHEILNENGNVEIYSDIINFLEEKTEKKCAVVI